LTSASLSSIGLGNIYTCTTTEINEKSNDMSKFFNDVESLIPSEGLILTEESYFTISRLDRQIFNEPFVSYYLPSHHNILLASCQNKNFSIAIINFRFKKFDSFYSCLKQNYTLIYNNSCGWEVWKISHP
jgi:hypothetical protein